VPLGAALLDLLELYGRRFNFAEAGITITDGGQYFSKVRCPCRWAWRALLLVSAI
jgi:DNA polymerase sigma